MALNESELLEIIRARFSEVLGVPVRDENLFELGGRSMDAARLSAGLQRATGRAVPVEVIFRNPSPGALAAVLAGSQTPAPEAAEARAAADVWPVTGTQERVVLRDEAHRREGKPPYIRTASWCGSIAAALDRAVLQRAVDAVVRRHASLRTTFAVEDRVVARVHEDELPQVEFLDYRRAGRAAAIEHATATADTAFDRRTLPRMRVICYDCGPAETLLTVVSDHVVSDGRSISIIVRDMAEYYGAEVAGRPAALEPLALTYGDWIARQMTPAGRRRRLELVGFWAPSVAENSFFPVAALPFARPVPLPDSFLGSRHVARVAAPAYRALCEFARLASTTPYTVQLASLYAYLHRITGEHDITLCAPDDNRAGPAEEQIVGWMATSMALRLLIPARPTFRDIVRGTHELLLSALEYRGIAFGEVSDAIAGGRRTRPVQVIRLQQSTPTAPARFGDAVATEISLPFTSAGLGLSMWIGEVAQELVITLLSSRENYSDEAAAGFLSAWSATMGELVEKPDQPITATDSEVS